MSLGNQHRALQARFDSRRMAGRPERVVTGDARA